MDRMVAKTIMSEIDPEGRDAIIERSLTRALQSYSVQNGVDKVVADKVAELAAGMMKTDDWVPRIEAALRAGFETYLQNLAARVPDVLRDGFHGTSGSYGGCAAIRRSWPDMFVDPKGRDDD